MEPVHGRIESVFLVRIWREVSVTPNEWRASVQDVRTGDRVYFTEYPALVDFLERRRK